MHIEVTREVIEAMRAAASAAHPREACGILTGEGNRIADLVEAANVHPDPETRFEIDPQALIDAHRAGRCGGAEVIGYFHSHPSGDAAPSLTDRAMAAHDGKVWAIAAGGVLKFWRDDAACFEELSYAVVSR